MAKAGSDFFVLSSGLQQTATNAAANIVAAEIQAGFHASPEDAQARFTTVAATIFGELQETADVDNAKLAERAAARPASGGGGKSFGGGGNIENPGQMVIKGGRFDGLTIEQVFNMSAEDAANDYGYTDRDNNPKAGREYIEWQASQNNNNTYSRARASAFLEQRRASSN